MCKLLRAAFWFTVALAVVLGARSLLGVVGPSEAGPGRAVVFAGLLLQTSVLAALALGLRNAAVRVAACAGRAWEEEELTDILSKRRAEVPPMRPPLAGEYERLTDVELLDVYARINAPAHPERFDALLWVIARRAAALAPPASAPAAPRAPAHG
jgi:hypothetical protein